MKTEVIPKSTVPESVVDIALRACPKSRVFSGGEIQLFATVEQFEALVRELVANRTKRILAALDGMDRGCREPGFRGHQNGYGEDAGDELQDAREELATLVGHVPAAEVAEPEIPWVATPMAPTQI